MPGNAAADLVLTGGAVYTVDAARSWAQAVAISGGRIAAVGSDAAMRPFVGPRTEVIDLRGRMVLPGFQDAHVHASGGGLERNQCDLSGTAQPRGLPGRDPGLRRPAPRSRMDHRRRLVHGRVPRRRCPARTTSTQAVPGPPGVPVQPRPPRRLGELAGARAGRHRRRAPRTPPTAGSSGTPPARPAGALHEGAMNLVQRVVPAPGLDEQVAGIVAGQRTCTRSASPPGRRRSSATTRWSPTASTPTARRSARACSPRASPVPSGGGAPPVLGSSIVLARTAGRGWPGPVPRHQREDHARRGLRELHGRHADPLPRWPRPPDRGPGHELLRCRRS